MEISFKIPSSGIFKPLKEWVNSHQHELEKEIKDLLQNYARDGIDSAPGKHYENRTGRLRDATKVSGSFGSDFEKEIELYVDTSEADYAKYVINGHGTWGGDDFINDTIKAKAPEIKALVEKFMDRAVQEFNRR